MDISTVLPQTLRLFSHMLQNVMLTVGHATNGQLGDVFAEPLASQRQASQEARIVCLHIRWVSAAPDSVPDKSAATPSVNCSI